MLPPDGPSTLCTLTQRAREMRKQATASERLLWNALRRRRLGVHVRRQHPLPPYVVDFYCHARRLVIEVDGGYHRTAEQRSLDAARDAELARLYGVRVVRIAAELVERDVAKALALVLDTLQNE